MKWCTQPYALLGMRKGSEYSDEQRLVPRPFRGKYVFIYPFVKSAAGTRCRPRSAGG